MSQTLVTPDLGETRLQTGEATGALRRCDKMELCRVSHTSLTLTDTGQHILNVEQSWDVSSLSVYFNLIQSNNENL